MSDEIPLHIQEEIMKRLPVKSLIRFRIVSKAWKSLIDSSEFIAAHSLHRHTQPQHLLVSYEDLAQEAHYVSYIDDVTFPQQRSVQTFPLAVKQLEHLRVVGTSCGLLCFYGSDPNLQSGMAVLWNPSIRKSIGVPVFQQSIFGFGVCPVTSDPKIITIRKTSEVMVYTLSSGSWRSLSNDLPTKGIQVSWDSVATDRFIYRCCATQTHNMVMSFDVTNENFEMTDLPDSLATQPRMRLSLFKLRESLAICEYTGRISTVWMMEDGVQRSFTKLFTISTPHDNIVGFRKNGIPIIQVTNDDDELARLVVYEPNSEHNKVLDLSFHIFTVNSYMETLLLLGRSDYNSN